MPTRDDFLLAVRDGALLVWRDDLCVIDVRGEDRVTWLAGMVTSDVKRASAGVAQPSLLVTQKGRVIADLLVIVEGASVTLVAPVAAREALLGQLERLVIMEDVELHAADTRVAIAYGPRASSLTAERARSFGYDEAGVPGAILLVDASTDLPEQGEVRADVSEWDAWRIERGLPRFGVDFDSTTYPQEAGLETRSVSFDKGCYVGQEVVFMLQVRGHVKRRLAKFVADGAIVPDRGASVVDASGAEIGVVTSAARGPESGAPVGLAMLKLAACEPDSAITAGGIAARVVG